MALSAKGKDIQDQHGAVNYTRLNSSGKIAHLRRGQVVVKNDQRNVVLFHDGGYFVHLTATRK